jgi:GrpB-like predicted nucleotidyltransferase (UPF0157 family)
LIGSIIALLGLDLAIPDHSTLSRRAELLALPRLPTFSTQSPLCRHWLWTTRSAQVGGKRPLRAVRPPVTAKQ